MSLERKIFGLAICAALAVMVTGCGGLQGSYNVSPATFFLPGLLDNRDVQAPSFDTPSLTLAPPDSESVEIFAKAQ